jgi:diguanylate cyclase (GGDEF)-like protein
MDITERKQFEAELERRAFYDSLTGLPNRALFMNRLSWATERYRNESRSGYAILFLDLDRFRLLNESLGHDVGDQLLQAVASHLEASLDTRHTVARFGGDEFTVLLEEVSGFSEVARLAERLQSGLNRAFSLKEHDIHTTCSIGIVLGSKEYQDESLLVRDAETAMQRAKIEGQNSIKAFNPDMHAQALKFLHLDTELRQALSKDELAVYYQPIVDLAEMRLIGFEGLVRWHHPQRGLLMPGDFISLAEDTDIILPMGRMILESACHQLKAWQDALSRRDLLMNINLSARQFSQPDLHEQVASTLRTSRIAPGCLELEITESDVMQNVEASTAMLSRIKELGVRLAIDDFGTGYSSLSYLQRFPIDSLKIDRSFVWGLETQRENLELIKTIVALSRNLGKELIAEGIETRAQLEKLRELGCRFGQGYYFAKPMDPSAATRYLEDNLPRVSPGG